MDPVTAGLITQAGKRALEHGKERFIDLFYSEVGAFLKVLKKEIGSDPTIPWEEISLARVNPEFVGIAQSMIDGNPGARDAMKGFLSSLEVPSTHADSQEVRQRIFDAMMLAAAEAPRSDRAAALASERRIEETVQRRETHDAASFEKRDEQLKRRLQGVVNATIQAAGLSAADLNPDQIRAQIEAEIWSEGTLDSNALRDDDPPAGPASSVRGQPAGSRALDLGLPAADVKAVDRLLDQLDRDDPDGAEILRGLLADGGMDSIVKSLRSGDLEGRSAVLLDAEAQIAGIHGAFTEAEQAHVAASERRETASDKARQLVRAAAMAAARGDNDRAEEYRGTAEGISPGHPAVAIAEARGISDPDEVLSRLNRIQPESDREAQVLHISRAQAFLTKGAFDQAHQALSVARRIDPDDLGVREVEAMLSWLRAHQELAEGRPPDTQELLEAARIFRALAADLANHNREAEQGQLLARAAEAAVMAGDLDSAMDALQLAPAPELMGSEASSALGNAAMLAGRPDIAAQMTADVIEDGKDGLALADAKLHSDSAEERTEAATRLVELLDSQDQGVRNHAAYSLLSGALDHPDLGWNERAADIVGQRSPAIAAVLRAEFVAHEGQYEHAESILLPHVGDSRAQRALINYAEEREDWPKAHDRLVELVKTRGDGGTFLRLAKAASLAGYSDEARDIYLRLARDTELDEALRGAAFGGAVEIAGNDFEEIRKLAAEWYREIPGDQNATWNLMFALARLARHSEAYELSVTERPDASTPERAILYAEILGRAASGDDALRAIAALSDRYDRKVEALEGLFIATALKLEQEDASQIDERMGERIRESLERFPERFPDQTFMQSFAAPTSAEEFEALLEDHAGGNTAQRQRQVQKEIVDGVQPVNTLAVVAPHSELGRAWAGLDVLPLGFANVATDRIEGEGALAAIGKGVIWDSAGMFVTGGLGGEHLALVRGIFPGSRIAQETLEDADLALANTPRKGHMETIQDPDTGAFHGLRESDDAELERIAMINRGMVEVARSLDPQPWVEYGADERLVEMYEGAGEHQPWRAMVATLALAKRLEMPLFSDDRWIRNAARAFGVEAFGTVALLDALAEKEAIDSDRHAYLRRALFAAGGWGLSPKREEMIAIARSGGFFQSRTVIGVLRDRASWRSQPVPYMHHALALLQVVFEEDRDSFDRWARQIIDALQTSTPEMPKGEAAKTLLALAWDLNGNAELSAPALRALIDVIRRLPLRMTDIGFDPVRAALDFILGSLPAEPSQLRAALFARVVGQLSLEDMAQAIEIYMGSPPTHGSQ